MPEPRWVTTHEWANNAMLRVAYYPEPLEGEHPSDCIHVQITEAGGKPRGWIMNIEDATCLIQAVSRAMVEAIDDRRIMGGDLSTPPEHTGEKE